ncbi:hypothetical protein [Bordetella ansorpii]|uniref:hypothetical protein n=1 Tax=Bordetella ansorpii TaxID=288768 RepID=UPI0008297106|nr:hypothetical protein [Bordetella ansorpii]
MSEHAPPPRSKLDVLYRDVLGEIAPLMDRVETAIKAADALMQRSHVQPEQAGIKGSEASSGRSADEETARRFSRSARDMDLATRALQAATVSYKQAALRHAWLTALLGLVAGFIGGALAGIALGGLWIAAP